MAIVSPTPGTGGVRASVTTAHAGDPRASSLERCINTTCHTLVSETEITGGLTLGDWLAIYGEIKPLLLLFLLGAFYLALCVWRLTWRLPRRQYRRRQRSRPRWVEGGRRLQGAPRSGCWLR